MDFIVTFAPAILLGLIGGWFVMRNGMKVTGIGGPLIQIGAFASIVWAEYFSGGIELFLLPSRSRALEIVPTTIMVLAGNFALSMIGYAISILLWNMSGRQPDRT